jgi:hypothetical protein
VGVAGLIGGYEIRIRKVGGPWLPWVDIGDVTEYQFTGLDPETQYQIQTRAYCESGTLSPEDTEVVTTPAGEAEIEIGYSPYFAYYSGPTNNSPFTNEFGPITSGSERFIVQPGDIKVFVVCTNATTSNVSTPSGFVHAPGSPFSNAGGTIRVSILWKRMVTNEPLATLDTGSPNDWATFYYIRGAVETGDPWIDTATVEGTGTSITFPSLLGEVNSMAFYTSGFDAAVSDSAFVSNLVNPNLSRIILHESALSSSNGQGHMGVTGDIPVAGEIGTTSCTLSSSLSYAGWCGTLRGATIKRPQMVGANGTTVGFVDGFGFSYPSFPLAKPEESNYVFMFVESENTAVTLQATGWTEAPNSPIINTGTNPTRLTIFYKKVAADADAFCVFDKKGQGSYNIVSQVRGAITTGNPFEAVTSNTGSGTSITIPGGTTTDTNRLVFQIAGTGRDINGASFSSWANGDLTSVTQRVNNGTTSGNGAGLAIFTGQKSVAGAFGNTTATHAVSEPWTAWSGAIIGASGMPTYQTNSSAFTTTSYPVGRIYDLVTVLSNDILIAVSSMDGAAGDIVYGEEYGWQLADLGQVNATGTGLSVAWKRASGLLNNVIFTSSNDHRAVTICTVKGLDPDNPFIDTDTATGSGTTITIPGGTSTEADQLVLHAISSGIASGGPVQYTTNWQNTDLYDLGRYYEQRVLTGDTGHVDTMGAYKNTVGVFGDTTVTLSNSTAWTAWRAILKTRP